MGKLWDFSGISWDFMGKLWDFIGISWENYGILVGFHGISWENYGISSGFHEQGTGVKWNFTEKYGDRKRKLTCLLEILCDQNWHLKPDLFHGTRLRDIGDTFAFAIILVQLIHCWMWLPLATCTTFQYLLSKI